MPFQYKSLAGEGDSISHKLKTEVVPLCKMENWESTTLVFSCLHRLMQAMPTSRIRPESKSDGRKESGSCQGYRRSRICGNCSNFCLVVEDCKIGHTILK